MIMSARAATAKNDPAGGRERILLVEDDADVRMVVRDALEASGYQIWEAMNGPEALNIWKTNAAQIDLLLSDIIMPGGLTGWDLAERLREQRPDLRVILMSGYSPEPATESQARTYILQKPFTLENLTKTVRNCLAQRAWSPETSLGKITTSIAPLEHKTAGREQRTND